MRKSMSQQLLRLAPCSLAVESLLLSLMLPLPVENLDMGFMVFLLFDMWSWFAYYGFADESLRHELTGFFRP
jgi:hypothetical protein